MKRFFKVTKAKHRCSTRLEEHLVLTAKKWCKNQDNTYLTTLEHFYNALQREKELYVENHRSARITSVRILLTETSVTINSADKSMGPTATIQLLTPEEIDNMDIQDSLLIPIRS